MIPGWFDKFLPWRQAAINEVDNLVLLCPSEEFIADLPLGKIRIDRTSIAWTTMRGALLAAVCATQSRVGGGVC